MNRLIALLILLAPVAAAAGRELRLTLAEAIDLARTRSVDAAVALDELRTAYWEWRTYRADRLPEVTFTATAPTYADQYSTYMNAAGEYDFVRNRYLAASGQLAISQNIPLTGGKVSLVSSLDFMRQFEGGAGNRFMTIPVALTLRQPIFGTNTLKWDSRIEPVRFKEAKAAFMSATEDVALAAVTHFFTLLLSRENAAIARQNLDNATRLHAVAVEKRRMGQISENDLLQMELNVLEARADLTEGESTLKADMFRLRSFLDLPDDTEILPELPQAVPEADITYRDALDRALANNKFASNMRRRQLEADYEVAKARGNLRQISLFAQIGSTGADTAIGEAYSRLRGNQMVEVGFSIPLVDWGKRRGKVKVAESNRRVTESRLRQEAMDFSQELFVLVERFCNQQEQLKLATRASEIARRRYDTNVQTFLIGRISTLDLNDSQAKKDESTRRYIDELYKFWSYWYQLRSLTLYDYEARDNINADIERILKD